MTATSISLGRQASLYGYTWPRVATQKEAWRVRYMPQRRPRRRRIPVHITLDPDVLKLLDSATYNRSRFIEDAVLERLSTIEGRGVGRSAFMVPRPGFEPGARARKARMFDRATPPGLDSRGGGAFKNLSQSSVYPHQQTPEQYQDNPHPPGGVHRLLKIGCRKENCYDVG